MFGNRRLAKRSIVGTKVCALWQDGRFYPGVIQNHPADDEPTQFFEARYTISFDDGYQRQVFAKDIVGPGFNNISNFTLKYGQKVYLTVNGREVTGIVAVHDRSTDEVVINVQVQNGEEMEIIRKSDELRLMESRKSARLVDQDTDYSKLADLNVSENKKRTVSHVIDVPSKSPRYRRPSTDDEDRENAQNDDNDVEMMDETIAAMVLTSLSTSPASPKFPPSLTELSNRTPGQTVLSSSANSSGFHSERSDPSPPLSSHLSESAPVSGSGGVFFGSFPRDEGIVLEENINELEDEYDDEPKRKRIDQGNKKMMFKCTWKGCDKLHNTCSGIEKHVRTAHLGLKENDQGLTDGEEEFYYTEIEVNVDNVTKTFSEITFTSSPPDHFTEFGKHIPDHDYQKKEHRHGVINTSASSVPSGGFFQSGSLPISMPQIKRSLSWQNNNTSSSPGVPAVSPSIRMNKPTPQERLQQHQAQSPKSHLFSSTPKQISSHKKPRSEVRKCRKVYGMENRDMWCTQCKWKKACSRFVD